MGRYKGCFDRPQPQRAASERRRVYLQRLRMSDGRRVERVECGRGVPMEVGEVADGRAVKRGRVLADPPEEMELRGEGWRRDEAARGRGVRQRTR